MTGCQQRVGTWVVGFLFGTIIAAPISGVEAAPNRSTWEALPPETAMALRVPDGQAILSALRQDTKLGAVLLQPGESISIDGNPSADGPVRNRKDALKGRD